LKASASLGVKIPGIYSSSTVEDSLLYVRRNQNSGEERPDLDKNGSDNIKYMDLYGLCSTGIIDIPDILPHSEAYSSFLCLFTPNTDGLYHL
jgi:hypothetical protein